MPPKIQRTKDDSIAKEREALEAERKAFNEEKADALASLTETADALARRKKAQELAEEAFAGKAKAMDDFITPDVSSKLARINDNKLYNRREYVCTTKCFHKGIPYTRGRTAWFSKGEYPMDHNGNIRHFELIDPAVPPLQPPEGLVAVNKE